MPKCGYCGENMDYDKNKNIWICKKCNFYRVGNIKEVSKKTEWTYLWSSKVQVYKVWT